MRKYLFSLLFLCALAPTLAFATSWTANGYGPADNYRPLRYEATDGQTAFSITWPFQAKADLRVYTTTNADLWPDIDIGAACPDQTGAVDPAFYTVTGAETSAGGTLTFTSGHERAEGEIVMILRDDCVDKTANYTTLTPGAFNVEGNRATTQAQQIKDVALHRAIQLPYSDDWSGSCVANNSDSDISPILPPIDDGTPHHAVVAGLEGCDVDWSLKSLDDFNCLTCPPVVCDGGANDGEPCGSNADCGGVCTASVCGAGTNEGDACTTNADCEGDCSGGFSHCDYISVEGGVLTCSNGTCPDSCEGGGGGGGCTTCGGDGVCLGGSNDGNACTNDVDCPDGGVCAFGTCSGGTGDGNACTDDADCPGGGTCEYNGCLNCNEFEATCKEGMSPVWDESTQRFKCARVGFCTGGTNDGKPCTDPADCPGGSCTLPPDEVCFGGPGDGNACTDDADCPEGGTCRPETGVCLGGSNDGNDCHDDADCPGGVCVDPNDTCGDDECVDTGDLTCQGGTHDGESCTTNADCPAVHLHPGLCATDSCPTCTGLCSSNSDCSGGCNCQADNICLGGPTDGDGCTDDTDCAGTCSAGVCDNADESVCDTNTDCGGVCAPRFTGETCQGGTADGDPCTDDADCPAPCVDGVCVGGPNDAQECTTNADCPGRCDTSDGVGVIGPSTSTDNAAVRWNGTTGKFVKDGPVIISDAGSVRGVQTLTLQRPGNAHFIKIGPPASADFTIGGNYLLPNDNPFHLVQTTNADDDAELVLVAHGEDNVNNKLYWRPMTYPIVISTSGLSQDGQTHRLYFSEDVNCPAGLTDSQFKAATAFTSTGVFTLKHGASTMGTVTFASGGSPPITGTVSVASRTQFLKGEFLEIDFPASADATGGTLSFTIACVKVL